MTGNPGGGERRCPDDLVVRGQREHLPALERQALAAHLSQCAACRGAAALAALFDAVPEVQPGDDDLIARVADRAVRSPRPSARWPRWQAAAVIVTVLTCGGATAAWMTYRQASSQRSALPDPPSKPAPGPTRRAARVVPLVESQPEGGPAAAGEAQTSSEPPRKPRPQPAAGLAPAPNVQPGPTAVSLFAEANAVRRSGDIRQAVLLYQSLRQRFPGSSQALLSAISLGDLLLADDPSRAVASYSAYLRDSPNGSLTEEALFGRARGLRMLGRTEEERRTWQELSRRFPRSAYQPTALRRLQELAP
jgi:TolA-binding protein